MYYKIRELSLSHEIILHYFSYRDDRNAGNLPGYCREVHRYERLSFVKALPVTTPYIIGSRNNNLLAERLEMDNYPVLLEGIHCAALLPSLADKKLVLRMHNDEAEYYRRLAGTESNIFKKLYHYNEARLLKNFQEKLNDSIPLACVSHSDMKIFREDYGKTNLHYIPSFTPWQKISNLDGSGDYCLYHGNLEVAENRKVALWLAEKIFDDNNYRLMIAGKGAGGLKLPKKKNIEAVNDPSDAQLDRLIQEAQVNILPSLNNTGLKLKLLHALMMGRHILTNKAGVEGTDLREAVTTAESITEYKKEIARLMVTPFTKDLNTAREKISQVYNNKANAAKLSALLY